jgi:hypothetical protein
MPKPTDRWLVLLAISVGVLVGLPAIAALRAPVLIVAGLLLAFGLLAHPVWNYPWIEQSNLRRGAALFVVAAGLVSYGRFLWPAPMLPIMHVGRVDMANKPIGDKLQIIMNMEFINDGDSADVYVLHAYRTYDARVANSRAAREARDYAMKFLKKGTPPATLLPSREARRVEMDGPLLPPKLANLYGGGKIKVFYSGFIVAGNNGGILFIPFCYSNEGVAAVYDCPSESKR